MSNGKAKRVSIEIGTIKVFVYRTTENEYYLAGRNVTDAVKEDNKTLPRFYGVKSLNDLPHAPLSLRQIKAESGETIIPIAIQDAIDYWIGMIANGNAIAKALVSACAYETIERRADRAFGVTVSEEERDERIRARMQRVLSRVQWTDIIKQDQESRGVYQTEYGNREFADLTRLVNRRLFNVAHFNCDRDLMTPQQQIVITSFEELLKRRYKKGVHIQDQVLTTLDLFDNVNH